METQLQTLSEKLEEFQLARYKDFCKIEPGSLTEIDRKIILTNSNYPLLKNIESQKQEDSLRKMIAIVCGLLGIKNLPDSLVLPLIMRFIRENFGSISCEAMLHGFELNALGMFEKKHDHFQCFSIEFIANVLNDYTELKRKALGEFKRITSPGESKIVSTDQENYQWLLDFKKKNNCFPISFNWTSVFNHLKESGIADESNEWMLQFKEKVKVKVKAEMHLQKLAAASAIDRINIDHSFTNDSLNSRCRKEYLIYKLNKIEENANG